MWTRGSSARAWLITRDQKLRLADGRKGHRLLSSESKHRSTAGSVSTTVALSRQRLTRRPASAGLVKAPGSRQVGKRGTLSHSGTSKTHVATWHGTDRADSSSEPRARKSLNRYGGGVFIRAGRPRATSPNSTQMLGNPALIGCQLLVSRGGSFLGSSALSVQI